MVKSLIVNLPLGKGGCKDLCRDKAALDALAAQGRYRQQSRVRADWGMSQLGLCTFLQTRRTRTGPGLVCMLLHALSYVS